MNAECLLEEENKYQTLNIILFITTAKVLWPDLTSAATGYKNMTSIIIIASSTATNSQNAAYSL